MTQYNPAISKLAIPARFLKLPVDSRGYPVPKFVEWIDGKPDFRVMDGRFLRRAVQQKLCWLCGEPLGRYMAFVIGPMCAINRTTAEPPCHLECARFAAKACPFLTQPKRIRNEADLPTEGQEPAGFGIKRNPGVTLIWVTESYRVYRAHAGGEGMLFAIGDATMLEWYARGRLATREEVMESINSGLPILREMAEKDGPDAMRALEKQIERGFALVPA